MIGINVAQLLLSPQGTIRRFAFDEDASAVGESALVGRVSGDARLLRTGLGIFADCHFTTALALDCARCLEPAIAPVRGRLQEEFRPTVDVRSGTPIREELDVDVFAIRGDHVLDLGEAIRQHVVMAAPLRPLCRPDCRGLCGGCGQNLNERACECAPGASDSPFLGLKQLLEATAPAPPVAPSRSGRRSYGRRPQT